jgi:hypothetical protein
VNCQNVTMGPSEPCRDSRARVMNSCPVQTFDVRKARRRHLRNPHSELVSSAADKAQSHVLSQDDDEMTEIIAPPI